MDPFFIQLVHGIYLVLNWELSCKKKLKDKLIGFITPLITLENKVKTWWNTSCIRSVKMNMADFLHDYTQRCNNTMVPLSSAQFGH